jgi:hypothetical protein
MQILHGRSMRHELYLNCASFLQLQLLNLFLFCGIVRFLFARGQDVAKAEEMIAAHLIWRVANMPINKASCINEFMKGKLYMRGTARRFSIDMI